MTWIFLSPHLDDAILSCGGLIHEIVKEGQDVQVWTICSGDPPPGPLSPLALTLHGRWKTDFNAPAVRRSEDIAACEVLGIKFVHFDIPECIYRQHPITGNPVIGTNEELFQSLPEFEKPLAMQVAMILENRMTENTKLVSPMAAGDHIDHHLVRTAVEMINPSAYYYPDYPYISASINALHKWLQPGWEANKFNVSTNGLAAWQLAVANYKTQISTFWSGKQGMEAGLQEYWENGGGSSLWRARPTYQKKITNL
jgi:LmbE family N-acetylglucosaminyl deacetylase